MTPFPGNTIIADGVNHCKPLLIFHSEDKKKNKKIQGEKKQYDSGVQVMWNPKAWCNETVMIQWLRNTWQYATANPTLTVNLNRHCLLSLDVFSGQKTDEDKQVFKGLNCTTSFVLSGCIGFVQVLNVAINKPLKNRIKELSEIHYDNHIDKWKNGNYSIGDCRIMVTHWVGQAWRELHAEQSHLIIKAFTKVSLSLAVDGSKDVELHVKDIATYKLATGPKRRKFHWTR